MKASYLETEDVEMWLENGILVVIFKSHITKADIRFSKQYVKDRFKVLNGVTRPIMVDINELRSTDKESRDYLAGEEASKFLCAGAIVVKSAIAKLLGSLFLSINKPPFPTRLFTNREKAMKWLEKYRIHHLN